MVLFLIIIIYISVFFLLHSYVFYPLHLLILYTLRNKREPQIKRLLEECPYVSCIISVYNEASVISHKIVSVLQSDFPPDKIKLYIGSDASTDDSNELIRELANKHPSIIFFPYQQRRGKTLVINDLVEEAFKSTPKSQKHILLFTDANVILTPNVIKNLCRHFEDSKLALVDTKIIPKNLNREGISYSENQYMSLEIKLKYLEGELWGAMMGAFGGCFAIRSSFIEKVPSRFLVDDFYISMSALSKGGECKNDLEAICYEGMPGQLIEEFRRKARISAGNFQNLSVFYKLLFKKPITVAYAFFSHKVLRWIGPLLILLIWLASLGLSLIDSEHYLVYFIIISSILVFIPIVDYFLSIIGIHIKLLRGIRYFLMMNIALLIGFIHYVNGIQNSSWEPPKRSLA